MCEKYTVIVLSVFWVYFFGVCTKPPAVLNLYNLLSFVELTFLYALNNKYWLIIDIFSAIETMNRDRSVQASKGTMIQ